MSFSNIQDTRRGVHYLKPLDLPEKRARIPQELELGEDVSSSGPMKRASLEKASKTSVQFLPNVPMDEKESKTNVYFSSNFSMGKKVSRTSVQFSPNVFMDEKESKPVRRKTLHDVVDQKEVIHRVRTERGIGFLYMVYSVPRYSELYTPYTLSVVPYEKIDKSNFLTISAHGVTQYYPGDMIFTPLDVWEEEYDKYCKLVKIKSFVMFRMWKGFYVWRRNVNWKKYVLARDAVTNTLFLLNPTLRKALLDIQAMCYKLSDVTFSDMSRRENLTLFEFIEIQMTKMAEVQERLKFFHDLVKDIVNNACHEALLSKGFTTDDSNIHTMPSLRKTKDGKMRMSYTEQANKRRYCIRLTSFIHLVDFVMLNMLHILMRNSLIEFTSVLESHFRCLPGDSTLMTIEINTTLEEPRPDNAPQLPLFLVDVLIHGDALCLEPCQEVLINAIVQLMDLWEETVMNVTTFLPDPFFNPFCEYVSLTPLINEKVEERLCGLGPDILSVLKEDITLIDLQAKVGQLLTANFAFAMKYIERFEFIRDFYNENEARIHDDIKNELDLETFRILLAAFHRQVKTLNKIVAVQPLGILYLRCERFKENTLPSPKDLLVVIENTLPRIGRAKIDALAMEAQDMQTFLEIEPRTTENYVEYLTFLENAIKKVDQMELAMDYTKELYDIIEEFKVPCGAEDLSNYTGFSVTLSSLRTYVEMKVSDKLKIVSKFNDQINKDISSLIQEVGSIKDEATQPWLIDIESNLEEAKKMLDTYVTQLEDCQKRAAEYRAHQRAFKLEVTRFDMLDEVMLDVKLRQLLWESVGEWDKIVEQWTTVEFSTLVPEDMATITAKQVKNIHQFEKGLPPNLIVPRFKENVEAMRDKVGCLSVPSSSPPFPLLLDIARWLTPLPLPQLPVITNLRNPALKQRHWIKVENTLNHKFTPDEEITLKLLEDVGVFLFPAELQEISGQASSEAGLETLLKKVREWEPGCVEEAWKTLEFVVLPHRDMKDVYILGGVEEIQQTVDESNINMNTIASSRHVGPIKPRVDEWIKQLDLFSTTLDVWLSCQQSWLYLESIFSAPDIQRQLPTEAKMFLIVDKSFKEIMRKTAKVIVASCMVQISPLIFQMPLAMQACTAPGILETFNNNLDLLDQIMKCLEAYLESKRVIFPRFYFLSNDELLEILAQVRLARADRKCFDAIARLEFGSHFLVEEETFDEETQGEEEQEEEEDIKKKEEEDQKEEEKEIPMMLLTLDIIAMVSPEGESVNLGKGLRARGNVEDWLGKVEDSMFGSLRRRMHMAMKDHRRRSRKKWILSHPSQIVLTVSQIMWCSKVHAIFNLPTDQEKRDEMVEFENKNFDDLNNLAAMVRGDLEKLQRMVLCSLITVDVHARDIDSLQKKLGQWDNFEWLRQLRYYWDEEHNMCVARMSSATYIYGYEYLGASGKLVITPLTDKCYLCLMGALQLDLGNILQKYSLLFIGRTF
uniref:Dynein heavy chain n=1 Tax=Timema cristinae TaxID=61476 RepID=A0A7R9CQE6_TIMCR|nr:unnamed protein product [Timema cristinae]